MARRSRLRTEKRVAWLEAVAESFKPGEPMRDLTSDEITVVVETLYTAMGHHELERTFPGLAELLNGAEASGPVE